MSSVLVTSKSRSPILTGINGPDQSLIWWLRFHRDFAYCDCTHFSLHFKDHADSPRSNDGRTLRSDLTPEICLPLQRSEIHLQPFAHTLPLIIHCFRSFTSSNLSSVCLSSSLLPSMTSIRCLLTEFANHYLLTKFDNHCPLTEFANTCKLPYWHEMVHTINGAHGVQYTT